MNFLLTGIDPALGYLITILSGFVWEIGENTEKIINKFRENSGPSQDYRGDSKINVIGDVIACQIGFAAAYIFSRYLGGSLVPAILYFVLSEVYTTAKYRDGMVLLGYQLLFNDPRVSAWQLEAIPLQFRETMDNREPMIKLLSDSIKRSKLYEAVVNKTRNALSDKSEDKVVQNGTGF